VVPNSLETDGTESSSSSEENDDSTFHYGFYLYCIVTENIEHDIKFMEGNMRLLVEISPLCTPNNYNQCKFNSRTLAMELLTNSFNTRNPDSKFTEWCRIYYERSYNPRKAYELWIKWVQATSQSVSDLVLKQWSRHAGKLKYHLFPVPEDAFAEPTNYLSSPLRSPIFVDLDVSVIVPEEKVNIDNSILNA
jgi:hypothetical protein